MSDSIDFKSETLAVLEEYKAREVKCMDIRAVTDMTDYMIVCSATSSRHAKTLAEQTKRKFKAVLPATPYAEGEDFGEWIVIDLHDVIVHIMIPEVRSHYQLEALWQELIAAESETPEQQ